MQSVLKAQFNYAIQLASQFADQLANQLASWIL